MLDIKCIRHAFPAFVFMLSAESRLRPSGHGLVVMYFCIGGADLNIHFPNLRLLHRDHHQGERGEARGRREIRQVLEEGAGSQQQSAIKQVKGVFIFTE